MKKPPSVIISSVGLLDDELVLLNSALASLEKKGFSYRDTGQRREDAQLLVINGDTLAGREALVQCYGEANQQIKLVLSRHVIEGPNIIWLIRPLSLDVLTSVLLRLSKDISKGIFTQGRSGITTFHLLFEAKQTGSTMALNLDDSPLLYVNAIGNLVATECDDEQLIALLAANLSSLTIQNVLITDIPAVSAGAMRVTSLDNMLWQAGLLWDSAELLNELHVEQVFKLKEWPNFSSNNVFPEHIQLASALSNQSLSLAKLQALTGISKKEVTCFINAAYAVGLIDVVAETPMPRPANEASLESKSIKSLFSRFKERVSRRSSSSLRQ